MTSCLFTMQRYDFSFIHGIVLCIFCIFVCANVCAHTILNLLIDCNLAFAYDIHSRGQSLHCICRFDAGSTIAEFNAC